MNREPRVTPQSPTAPDVVPAGPAHLEGIRSLLASVGLSASGIEDHVAGFLIVREGNRIIAAAGIEDCGTAGLLRSVAVAHDHRSRGLASRLVSRLIQRSRALGHGALYLRTSTAERYFQRFGFQRVDLAGVAPEVLRSAQFNGERCASSETMVLEFNQNQIREEGRP